MNLNQIGSTMSSKSTRTLAGGSDLSATVRIARALIGATPEELAVSVGVPPETLSTPWATRPIPSLSGLASAMRTIMSFYSDTSGVELRPAGANPHDPSGLGTIVTDYIALRSGWENREARSLAAWMTDGKSASTASPKLEQTPVAPATRRRALIVDDSSDISIVIGAFLNDSGFDVAHAACAEAALLVLADGTPVDLLVTDYAMPGMNGKDLVVQAREQNPKLAALIISGYADSPALAKLPDGVTLLAKPFRRAELYNRIRSVIEHPDQLKEVTTTRPEIPSVLSPATTERSWWTTHGSM